MTYKLDLHTHSVNSPDGALSAHDYLQALESHRLDYIAVTDHNSIDFAQVLQEELGERIIVGEEITTSEGEIIGLFLQQAIPAGLTALATVTAIHAQGGLVYIPHPFETVRKGLSLTTLDSITTDVDIIETCNGRAVFQNKSAEAISWAMGHDVPQSASSDSHGRSGWTQTYSVISQVPTAQNLPHILRDASYATAKVSTLGLLYPKFNRLRKALAR